MEVEPFGEALRRLRLRAGLTQEGLAERAGLSANAVSALERGVRRRPYPNTVDALARVLRLTEPERAALRAGVADPRPPDLPALPSVTLGRAGEIDDVVGLLRGGHRLVTLTGPGGVGKTRVAVEAVGELVRRTGEADRVPCRDGAVFVSLAGLRDPADLLPAVAERLGPRELGRRELPEVLAGYLRARHLLVVLDNVEHLLPAAVDVADLLARAPGLTVLATSRAPLRIAAERVYPVPPLTPSAAVELFLTRAASAAGTTPPAEPDVVERVCRGLDNLPLAIELAAARTRLLTCDELLARLVTVRGEPDGGDPAGGGPDPGPRDAPTRQRTLRATVDWSYRLLDPDAQALLRSLSVFAGGWTVPAAAAVAGLPEDAVLGGHLKLLDNSLVARDLSNGRPRFGMLETIRGYAADRLDRDAAGPHEPDAVRDRHADYFARWGGEAGARLWRDDQVEVLDDLDAEHQNLRVALRRLLDRGRVDQLAETSSALWLLWVTRGHLRHPQAWTDAALAAGPDLSPLTAARLSYVAAWSRLPRGYFAEAAERFGQAAALSERTGDGALRCWALAGWAYAEVSRGAVDTAERLLAEAVPLCAALGELHAETCAVLGLAHVALARGRLAEAGALLAERRRDIEERGAAWPLAVALGVLGRIDSVLGRADRAAELLTRSVGIFGQLRDTWGMAHQLTHVADAAALRGELDRAALLYGAIDALSGQTGAVIFPIWRELSDHCRSIVPGRLGAGGYRALHERGQRLSHAEVVALASGHNLPTHTPATG